MQYALLFYTVDDVLGVMEPAAREAWFAEMYAWRQTLADAGVLRAGLRLAPSAAAKSLRRDGGEMLVTDGPFAETKEYLGGLVLIECPDLDAALAWARRCPITRLGTVEVRPEHEDSR